MREIGEIIRTIRKRREDLGYSLGDLSRLTGISKSSLSRYESGERSTLRQFGYHAVEDFETYQIIRRDPADSLRMQRKSRPRGASAETAVKWNCQ